MAKNRTLIAEGFDVIDNDKQNQLDIDPDFINETDYEINQPGIENSEMELSKDIQSNKGIVFDPEIKEEIEKAIKEVNESTQVEGSPKKDKSLLLILGLLLLVAVGIAVFMNYKNKKNG